MKRDKWNIKFDWIQSGETWVQQDRNEQYNENRFISINDVYFKNQKYLSGVSYTYINKLDDIYKRDLLTGDGYSLYNMYNECDIIDRVMKNIQMVDVGATSNIDITKQWQKINDIQLKSGQYILLANQDSEYENDVYKVTQQYYLENANFLLNRTLSERFSVSIKMGVYKDKQFFLLNNGLDFPITGEPKHFIEGNSFILKHIIKYNLYNTSSNSAVTSKIFFTDYEIAKKQLSVNYSLYNNVEFSVADSVTPTSDYFQIYHHHDSFIMRTGSTSDRAISGLTSQITNNTDSLSGGTTISGITTFIGDVGDYIIINIISGLTVYLSMNTHIKISDTDLIVLEDVIPNRLLNYTSGMIFNLYNWNIATSWTTAISQLGYTLYSRFFDVSDNLTGSTHNLTFTSKEYVYDKYFDYNDLTFKVNDEGLLNSFSSLNNYITYNLNTRLNLANPSVFDSGFTFHNSFSASTFSASYTDDSRIKLSFTNSGDTSNFREFTYVELIALIEPYKVMIWKIDGGDIYVEKPAYWSSGTAVTSLQNIDGLSNISDILQEVYINTDYDWYISKKENIRRNICSAYAQLLSENVDFRKNATGILYENEFNEFILKLYDLENDYQLDFSTIELMRLGADRKTRIPVPLNSEELIAIQTESEYWDVLDDGLVYSGSTALDYISTNTTDDIFDGGLDSVLGGPNDPPLLFNIIDGN